MTQLPLAGKKVLVLEDEPLIAMLTEAMVVELGGTVAGPFAQIAAAQQALLDGAADVDLALLDVNVNGERSDDLARILRDRGVPVVFCTGYDKEGIGGEWGPTARLGKPFSEADLAAAVTRALAV